MRTQSSRVQRVDHDEFSGSLSQANHLASWSGLDTVTVGGTPGRNGVMLGWRGSRRTPVCIYRSRIFHLFKLIFQMLEQLLFG